AVIDWYVRSTDPGRSGDRIHYQGAGFVNVSTGKDGASFLIRNAQVSPREQTGALADPLGPSNIEGSFFAPWNTALVQSTLADVRGDATPAAARQ
ncbi:MAG: hypothetical protein ACREJC_11690, partial [Tepidisphaeraceae bacterium]